MTADPFQNILTIVQEPMQKVEQAITQQADFFTSPTQELIKYVCASSGKRLRPILALLAGGASGGINLQHITLSAVLELIHMASLVHDDIIDEAELRRDKATISALHGNHLGVFVGDLLLAHALRLTCRLSNRSAAQSIAQATAEVCRGEILQTQQRGSLTVSVEAYVDLIRLKTGGLFEAATGIGAMLSGAEPPAIQALRRFGSLLGIAYQIYDDCLDITGKEEEQGKTLGSDLRKGKLTLPMILLLQATSNRPKVEKLLQSGDGSSAIQLVHLIRQNGSLQSSIQAAADYVQAAMHEISSLQNSAYQQGLQSICLYVRQRVEQLR